jgi:hypothetical protein
MILRNSLFSIIATDAFKLFSVSSVPSWHSLTPQILLPRKHGKHGGKFPILRLPSQLQIPTQHKIFLLRIISIHSGRAKLLDLFPCLPCLPRMLRGRLWQSLSVIFAFLTPDQLKVFLNHLRYNFVNGECYTFFRKILPVDISKGFSFARLLINFHLSFVKIECDCA